MWKKTLLLLLALICAAAAIYIVSSPALFRQTPQVLQADLVAQSAPQDSNGFARADQPVSFNFPADHGLHPEYQTEWWYYTGNLESPQGERFGYQLTFFRRALLPPSNMPERDSTWGSSQVYMAHFAVTAPDLNSQRFQAYERFSRGAAGLAGAQAQPFKVWLENWHVEEIPGAVVECTELPETAQPCVYQLFAGQNDLALNLTLRDTKGAILQGDEGYSQKGSQPGNASYYYSLTRLETEGFIEIAGERFQVNGLSWMDHEYSTSALSEDQVGWDWFSMQFDDGSELMVFQIRKADGSIDPFSSGTLIAPDGSTTHLSRSDFTIDVLDRWESPHTGTNYPSRWAINIPKAGLALQIKPIHADQELNLTYTYWEGAIQVDGTRQNEQITGSGYVELTGYSTSMGGEF